MMFQPKHEHALVGNFLGQYVVKLCDVVRILSCFLMDG